MGIWASPADGAASSQASNIPSTSSQRRHLPLSVRRTSAQRKPSTPHLSVVFADPSLSHGAIPSRPGTLASEDALARQMNAGGEQMGLRSRRSSSATVQTMRSISGVGTVQEEEREIRTEEILEGRGGVIGMREDVVAGPSVAREVQGNVNGKVGSGGEVTAGPSSKTLNPKLSSSWLRWNAQSGFPRSRTASIAGVDKGKGKEREIDPVKEIDTISVKTTGPTSTQTTDSPTTIHPPPILSEIPPSEPIPPSVDTSLLPPPESSRHTTRQYRKNWWNSTASPTPSIRRRDKVEPKVDSPFLPIPEPTIPDPTPPPVEPIQPPAPVEIPDPAPVPEAVKPNEAPPVFQTQTKTEASSKGWMTYIWGNPAAPPLPSGEMLSSDNTVPLASPSPPLPQTTTSQIPVEANDGKITSSPISLPESIIPNPSSPISPDPSLTSSMTNVTPSQQPDQTSGWGTFLFSLVVPQIAVSRSLDSAQSPSHPGTYPTPIPSTEETSITVNPAEEQPPEPTIPPSSISPSSMPSETIPSSELIPDSNPGRKASTSSQAGWLSYLAYRSTQKRVTNGSIRSDQAVVSGRNSEEVMDFSVDPNFPSSDAAQSAPKGDKEKAKDTKKADISIGVDKEKDKNKMPPPKSIPNKQSTPSLSVLGKRQSTSSGTHTPLSSSPKTSGFPDSSPKPSSITSTTLPTPPTVPSAQPNLVIPTFGHTFERPPRSFLPLIPPKPDTQATGGSTGLAWRALSVAGSYVYPGIAEKGKGKDQGKELEKEKETRGRKEGRNVGADLPRRIGLGGEDPDAEWKGVKRVVVVGVHGW